MTTIARDFKFAGAIVQRLYLVMVALTKNRLSAQYGWFCHGRSHMQLNCTSDRWFVCTLNWQRLKVQGQGKVARSEAKVAAY